MLDLLSRDLDLYMLTSPFFIQRIATSTRCGDAIIQFSHRNFHEKEGYSFEEKCVLN